MTEKRKLISVVIPTYNQAKYLATCLDSIWFQDYPNIEIIVVADPSPDNTSEVLREFACAVDTDIVSHAVKLEEDGTISRSEYPRYRKDGRRLNIVENESRKGHTPSYNIGFKLASGDYCTYVASDDICHPQMLSEMAEYLDNDEADFVYSDMFIVDDDLRILREFKLPDYSFKACFCDWYLCGVSKLYRSSLHKRSGYFDNAFIANDHECYQQFAIDGARFKHIRKTLYSIRSHGKRNNDVHSIENRQKMLDESRNLVRLARDIANAGFPG